MRLPSSLCSTLMITYLMCYTTCYAQCTRHELLRLENIVVRAFTPYIILSDRLTHFTFSYENLVTEGDLNVSGLDAYTFKGSDAWNLTLSADVNMSMRVGCVSVPIIDMFANDTQVPDGGHDSIIRNRIYLPYDGTARLTKSRYAIRVRTGVHDYVPALVLDPNGRCVLSFQITGVKDSCMPQIDAQGYDVYLGPSHSVPDQKWTRAHCSADLNGSIVCPLQLWPPPDRLSLTSGDYINVPEAPELRIRLSWWFIGSLCVLIGAIICYIISAYLYCFRAARIGTACGAIALFVYYILTFMILTPLRLVWLPFLIGYYYARPPTPLTLLERTSHRLAAIDYPRDRRLRRAIIAATTTAPFCYSRGTTAHVVADVLDRHTEVDDGYGYMYDGWSLANDPVPGRRDIYTNYAGAEAARRIGPSKYDVSRIYECWMVLPRLERAERLMKAYDKDPYKGNATKIQYVASVITCVLLFTCFGEACFDFQYADDVTHYEDGTCTVKAQVPLAGNGTGCVRIGRGDKTGTCYADLEYELHQPVKSQTRYGIWVAGPSRVEYGLYSPDEPAWIDAHPLQGFDPQGPGVLLRKRAMVNTSVLRLNRSDDIIKALDDRVMWWRAPNPLAGHLRPFWRKVSGRHRRCVIVDDVSCDSYGLRRYALLCGERLRVVRVTEYLGQYLKVVGRNTSNSTCSATLVHEIYMATTYKYDFGNETLAHQGTQNMDTNMDVNSPVKVFIGLTASVLDPFFKVFRENTSEYLDFMPVQPGRYRAPLCDASVSYGYGRSRARNARMTGDPLTSITIESGSAYIPAVNFRTASAYGEAFFTLYEYFHSGLTYLSKYIDIMTSMMVPMIYTQDYPIAMISEAYAFDSQYLGPIEGDWPPYMTDGLLTLAPFADYIEVGGVQYSYINYYVRLYDYDFISNFSTVPLTTLTTGRQAMFDTASQAQLTSSFTQPYVDFSKIGKYIRAVNREWSVELDRDYVTLIDYNPILSVTCTSRSIINNDSCAIEQLVGYDHQGVCVVRSLEAVRGQIQLTYRRAVDLIYCDALWHYTSGPCSHYGVTIVNYTDPLDAYQHGNVGGVGESIITSLSYTSYANVLPPWSVYAYIQRLETTPPLYVTNLLGTVQEVSRLVRDLTARTDIIDRRSAINTLLSRVNACHLRALGAHFIDLRDSFRRLNASVQDNGKEIAAINRSVDVLAVGLTRINGTLGIVIDNLTNVAHLVHLNSGRITTLNNTIIAVNRTVYTLHGRVLHIIGHLVYRIDKNEHDIRNLQTRVGDDELSIRLLNSGYTRAGSQYHATDAEIKEYASHASGNYAGFWSGFLGGLAFPVLGIGYLVGLVPWDKILPGVNALLHPEATLKGFLLAVIHWLAVILVGLVIAYLSYRLILLLVRWVSARRRRNTYSKPGGDYEAGREMPSV